MVKNSRGGSSSSDSSGASRTTQPDQVIGRLIGFGRAPYRFQRGEPPSYYVRLRTTEGTITLWGVGLERAMAQASSPLKQGDQVAVRRTGRELVTYTRGGVRAKGYRSLWQIDTPEQLANRLAEARRQRDAILDARREAANDPALRGTFLSLRIAELVAEKRIADPRQRERFLALVKEAMTTAITRHTPLPGLRISKSTPAQDASDSQRTPEQPADPMRARDPPVR